METGTSAAESYNGEVPNSPRTELEVDDANVNRFL